MFVVEHMEEYLFPWCLHEYYKMLEYTQNTGIRLCFTNARTFLSYQGPKTEENHDNIEALKQAF